RSARFSPSTNSITRYGTTVPSGSVASPQSYTWVRLGWLRPADRRASRTVAERGAGRASPGDDSSFSATSRSSSSSCARHTCDIPPAPMLVSNRNLPRTRMPSRKGAIEPESHLLGRRGKAGRSEERRVGEEPNRWQPKIHDKENRVYSTSGEIVPRPRTESEN